MEGVYGQQQMAECRELELNGESSKEEIFAAKSSNKEDAVFDDIIGHIQDILLDEGFSEVQSGFMEKYYSEFEDSEENKFTYTDIFKQYTELVEGHLETELRARVTDFSMEKLMKSLESRKDEVCEEIFDMLLSFTDFLTFKQAMLDYKAEKEGTIMDLGGLVINSLNSTDR